MKRHVSFAALLFGLCCAVLCLCSCTKQSRARRTVSSETLRQMQKTQSELATCVERCKSAAEDSKDREILLALANSQQVLADRHATIIRILLKKNDLDRISTVSYPIEMDPRTLLLAPVDEYKEILDKADPEKTLREVLIALEVTNKVLESDKSILNLIDPDSLMPFDGNFYLCPVCGHLSTEEPEGSCPICQSDMSRIIALKDGEIPPQNKESFVIVSE